jgi:hypothetical protein
VLLSSRNQRYNQYYLQHMEKMEQPITIDEIKLDPLRIATTLQAPSGLCFTFRPLIALDNRFLGEYFMGLSEQTKALYGPHPFDQVTADKLCAEINYADTIRFIATLSAEGQEQVIAYFILMLGLTSGEMERYPKAGIAVDPKLDCLIAPCVADAYQGQGLGFTMHAPHDQRGAPVRTALFPVDGWGICPQRTCRAFLQEDRLPDGGTLHAHVGRGAPVL